MKPWEEVEIIPYSQALWFALSNDWGGGLEFNFGEQSEGVINNTLVTSSG